MLKALGIFALAIVAGVIVHNSTHQAALVQLTFWGFLVIAIVVLWIHQQVTEFMALKRDELNRKR